MFGQHASFSQTLVRAQVKNVITESQCRNMGRTGSMEITVKENLKKFASPHYAEMYEQIRKAGPQL